MSLHSFWTKEAEASFGSILDYLEAEWGALVAEAFAADVEHTIMLLEVFPLAGVMEVPEKGIRSIPVARQVRLFYRSSSEALFILDFVDTRTERFQGTRV